MNEDIGGAVHRGHRGRMRAKLKLHGPRIFDTYELLEMLLYYVIPYSDTNPLAKRLLSELGSLDGVLSAKISELLSVRGIGKSSAALISAVNRLEAECDRRSEIKPCLDSREAVADFIGEYFRTCPDCNIVLLLLDNSMRLLRAVPIVGARFSSGAVQPRDFVSSALDADASSAIVGYTYRDIVAFPHDGDMETGIAIRGSLNAVGVPLLDIFVAGEGDLYALYARLRYKRSVPATSTEGRNSAPSSADYLAELLSYALGEGARECALSLCDKYGGISSVLSVEAEELMHECGLSESVALFIKLIAYLDSRRRMEGLRVGKRYTDSELLSFSVAAFIGEACESVFMIALNSEGRVAYFGTVGSGTVNRTSMFARKVAELAVRNCADRIIIAHNHPRGVAEPSRDDVDATTGLFLLLRSLGVRLASHLVIAGRDTCIIQPDAETGKIKRITLVSSDAELAAGTVLG